MQRVALLAILSWLALGCSSSPTTLDEPDGSSSSGDSGDSDSSVTGTGPITDGGAGGTGGDAAVANKPPLYCDSGAPLTLKTAWPLPAVDTTEGIAVTVDSQGNVYVTGTFNGSVKFGSTTLTAPTAPGTNNMFLAKYDPSGNVVLAKSWGTTTGVYLPPAIAVDSAGNVLLGGMFANTLDFGGTSAALEAVSYGDGFTVKLSPAGDALWAVRFGYSNGAAILSITVAPDGNPIVAGSADGDVVLGSTTWPAAGNSTQQPFIAKLSTTTGAVLWGNATGGDIKSSSDIFVSTDGTGHVFVAARVESGGGAWGGGADGGNFSALRAGFAPDGSIMWGQVDYGAFPAAAAVDHAGRFWVLEDAQDTVTLSGTTRTFGDGGSGIHSVSTLFSPVDGTLLSGLDIGDTFPNAGAVDGHGNSLVTGTYWPSLTSPPPLAGLTLPASSQNNQPTFLAALDGLSRAVSSLAVPTTGAGQPYAMAVDPGSGNIFVLGSLGTSTSDSGAKQPSLVLAVFAPDPCNDGAGPSGPSTGTPGNHGVLSSDGGSTYVVPDAGAPAACPASTAGAVNGAACPVAMGCSYATTCCICAPASTPCNGQPTLWTCSAIQNDAACPSSPPTPGTACPSTTLKCNYCEPGGRLYANCNAGGWNTGYAQILCP